MKTKAQLENEMMQLFTYLQEMLAINFRIQRNLVEAEAKNEALQLFKKLINGKHTVFAQYNAALQWCAHLDPDNAGNFNEMKKRFVHTHETHFKAYIQVAEKNADEAVDDLIAKKTTLKEDYEHESGRMNQAAHDNTKQMASLKTEAKKLTHVRLAESLSHDDFQVKMRHLKLAIATLQLPEARLVTQTVKARSLPVPIDLVACRQQKSLEQLDVAIKHYQAHLANESTVARVAKSVFSASRSRRKQALEDYEQQVQSIPITQISKRYKAAEAWLANHENDLDFISDSPSRFYRVCIQPFQYAVAQNAFCALPVVNQKCHARLIKHEATLVNATKTHNQVIAKHNAGAMEIANEYQTLHADVADFVKAVDTISDSAFGYIQGNTHALHAVQKAIIRGLIDSGRAVQQARTISSDILTLERHAEKEKVLRLVLKPRLAEISDCPAAMKIIDETIQLLIEDTARHGGTGNNFQYLGTDEAELIIKEIGSEKQIADFNNKKRIAINSREILVRSNLSEKANDLVAYLALELESGNLARNLEKWTDAYQKHKRINGKISDKESENIYKTIIRKHVVDAEKMHNTGDLVLQEFVKKAMVGALKASHLNEIARARMTAFEKLGVENVTMMVIVFGTKNQKQQWQRDMLPRICGNQSTKPILEAAEPNVRSRPVAVM